MSIVKPKRSHSVVKETRIDALRHYDERQAELVLSK